MRLKLSGLFKTIKFEYKITLAYLIFGFLWIFSSNNVINFFESDSSLLTKIQFYIGSLFVVVTAPILYFLVKRHIQKLVEGSIRKSEEKYRAIFENVQDVFYQTDLNGIILEISPSIKHFSEFIKEDLIGKPVQNLYAVPGEREILLQTLHQKGEIRDYEISLKTQQGDIKYVSINARLINNSNGTPDHIDGAIRDITDRVKAEESLRISEKKFRNLFQNHVAVKIIVDPDTGNIVDANFAASRFYGWSIDELKQMKIGEINTASPEVMQKTFKQVLAFEKVNFEFQHRCRDGSIKEVEVRSSKIEIHGKDYFHAIVHDITDKKKAEEQIRLLSLTIEQSPIMVLITDPQAKIKYVNPSFINTTGYSRKEVIGENPRIFNSSMQSREFYLKLWETILAGKHWSGEFQDRKKNGEIYWVEASISPLMNEIGQITHFVMIKEDISEKRKMMEDLIKAKEKAEASDRLKTAFMNNISHEIRTPLNSIQGFAPLIIDPTLNVDEKQEFIKIFNLSSLRLIETITDYMDISLITSDTMDVVKDDFYLEGVIRLIQEQFHLRCCEKKLILSFELPEDIHSMTINSDQELLLKILIHLMDNAIKFTKSGEITVGVSAKDNFYEFFVRDTGKGIKKEYLSSIFKHFVQEDESNTRAYEGSGLGLAIVNGLVTLLGGSIRVDSEKGIGSTFTFDIQS